MDKDDILYLMRNFISSQCYFFFSVVQLLCLTLWDPMDCSIPGFPVLHHLLEFVQIHGSIESWCHPTISSSAPPFSFCLWFFLASGSSPVSLLFASGDQSIRASASILPMNIQDWFPLGFTGWISFAVQGTPTSLLQHHNSKASILWHSVFFPVQLSHTYMTTGKTIALTIWIFFFFFFFLQSHVSF